VDQGVYDELPLPLCAGPLPECVPVELLTCGASFHTSNDAAGSTDEHVFYGCSDFVYTGPELVWRMITDQSEPVTVSMTGVTADLDLYVLDSLACNGTGCVQSSSEPNESNESLTFDAVAGAEYYIVVDGWEGAVSEFDLTVDCQGGLPEPDAGPGPGPDAGPLADGAQNDAVTGGADAATDASPTDDGNGVNSGCNCQTPGPADGPNGPLLVLLIALLGLARLGRRIGV
jgi:MYXO-CTERM domain-containing protein